MYNILITKGEENKVKDREKYDAHLWIHNGVIKKNNIAPKSLKTFLKSIKGGNY